MDNGLTILLNTETSLEGGVNKVDVEQFCKEFPDTNIIFSGRKNVGDWLWILNLKSPFFHISLQLEYKTNINFHFVFRITESIIKDLSVFYNDINKYSLNELFNQSKDYNFEQIIITHPAELKKENLREEIDLALFTITKTCSAYIDKYYLESGNIVRALSIDSVLNNRVIEQLNKGNVLQSVLLDKILSYTDKDVQLSAYGKKFICSLNQSKIIDYKIAPKIPKIDNDSLTLKDLVNQKLNDYVIKRDIKDKETYRNRSNYELSVVNKMGFASYFLHLVQIVELYKSNDIIIGPGRGSATGSLVSFLLGITTIDPMKYDLLFERFLNPDRISMPDIDLDISSQRREEIHGNLINLYGEGKVSRISNLIFRQLKTAGLDAIGSLTHESDAKKLFSTFFQDDENISLEKIKQYFFSLYSAKRTNHLVRLTSAINNRFRQYGVHACGYIVGDNKFNESLPFDYEESIDFTVTRLNANMCEDLGQVKIDLLSSKSLDVVAKSLSKIKKNEGITIDIDSIDLEDKSILDLFSNGDTLGIHQFGSSGIKKAMKKVGISSFNDIVAMNALFRPGSLKYISLYADRKKGHKNFKYLFPEMKSILDVTHGITIYQEQVMQLVVLLFGFSNAQADIVRKAIGKKKSVLMNETKELIYTKAKERRMDMTKVESLWKQWESFGSYGFNKSHSVAYSLLAYWHGYLKVYYPGYFYAARLNSAASQDERTDILSEVFRKNIHIEITPFPRPLKFTLFQSNKLLLGLSIFRGITNNSYLDYNYSIYSDISLKNFTFFRKTRYKGDEYQYDGIPRKILFHILLCSQHLEVMTTDILRIIFGRVVLSASKKTSFLNMIIEKQKTYWHSIKSLDLFESINEPLDIELAPPSTLILEQFRLQRFNIQNDFLAESKDFINMIRNDLKDYDTNVLTLSEFIESDRFQGCIIAVLYKESTTKYDIMQKIKRYQIIGHGFGHSLLIPIHYHVKEKLNPGDIVVFKSGAKNKKIHINFKVDNYVGVIRYNIQKEKSEVIKINFKDYY